MKGVNFSNIYFDTMCRDVLIDPGLRNTIFPLYIDLTKREADSSLSCNSGREFRRHAKREQEQTLVPAAVPALY